MTHLADSVARVRAAHEVLGSKELSRRSGISYTTVRDWAARGFRPTAVEVLERLERAAVDPSVEAGVTDEVEALTEEVSHVE